MPLTAEEKQNRYGKTLMQKMKLLIKPRNQKVNKRLLKKKLFEKQAEIIESS